MPAVSASAPAKTILLGEHAVVYNRPAIAVPLPDYQAHVTVQARPKGNPGEIWIDAADINLSGPAVALPAGHPFSVVLEGLTNRLGRPLPACLVRIRSTIPVAAGLGSSAAVSVALIRGLGRFTGLRLTEDDINQQAYAVEQRQHGTPSGIDNTVIVYNQPVFFRRGQPFELLRLKVPLTLVVCDSGVAASTAEAVAGVHSRWQADPNRYEQQFDRIGGFCLSGREALAIGDLPALGGLMNENQAILEQIGVSTPALERLIAAARLAGALGAKLSGGGLGGNIIALVREEQSAHVAQALRSAGAAQILITSIPATP